jgi:hypothetical protein
MCWRICSASSASEHAPTGPGRPAIVTRGARVSGSSSRPPVGQRAFTLQRLDLFTLQRLDLGVQQFVVHGDLAHLGFQPGDLVVAVIAFFQGCSRACERTLAPLGQPGDRDIGLSP